MKDHKLQASHDETSMPEHVGHNIHMIATLFAKAEQRGGRQQLVIERMTDVFGRPATLHILSVAVVGWVIANALAPRFGLPQVDPPTFVWLQGAACIAALLVTVIILTTQNRLGKLAQHRAHLDLQVNLIAEEKIAKVIALLEELRRDLPSVKNRNDPLAKAMTEAANAHAVAEELEVGPGIEDRP